jgi:hypothetical protein
MEVKVNKYMAHMLERAREIHQEFGGRGHGSKDEETKCPFCIADADETKFINGHDKDPQAPYCFNCPLLTLFNIHPLDLLDDCESLGKWALEVWETSDG